MAQPKIDDVRLTGLTMKFAKLAETLRYEDLPQDVIDRAKVILRDSIGVQIAASATSEPAQKVIDLVQRWGGQSESTIVAYGTKLPTPHAAMCNAMLAHGIQFDDTHSKGLIKAGAVLVPSVFAATELSGANGKETIVSLVIGYEIAARIAKAINPGHRRRGFHTSGTVAGFGAAAMTARLLGLKSEQIAWALGLAGSQAGGLVAFLDDPCMSKPLLCGKAAYNGVLSGVLASEGFTGPKNILEGNEGFFNAFCEDIDMDVMLDGFGERYVIMEVGLKPHAACRYSHAPIDLAQKMYNEDGIRLKDIDSGTIKMSEIAVRQTSIPVSKTLEAAMGSTEFGVAAAFELGYNGLPECWAAFDNPAVHYGAKKFFMEVEPSFAPSARDTILEVRTTDGRIMRYQQPLPKGEPSFPMTALELERKFFSLAGLVMDEAQAHIIAERIMTLENEPRSSVIPKLTAVPEGKPVLRAA